MNTFISPSKTYLLRCWNDGRANSPPSAVWRFRLENPRTGEHWSFTSPESLSAFLRDSLSPADDDAPIDGRKR